MSQSSTINDQWIRKWSLVVYNNTGKETAIVLSSGTDQPGEEQLRFVFDIQQTDTVTPNVCIVRIYNISTNTAMSVIKQFSRLTLSAGYANGRYGTLFDGTITQFNWGGETAVDTYLELTAQDADIALNNSTISATVVGTANNPQDRVGFLAKSLTPFGLVAPASELAKVPQYPVQPRGQVYFGMVADHMDDTVNSVYINGQPMTWSVQNGVLTLVPSNAAITDGEVFVLNSATGLIGFPNTTSDGVNARTLLNPGFAIRHLVNINNAEINKILAQQGGQIGGLQVPIQPGFTLDYILDTSNDGTYLILVVNHHGDSRGNDWYSDLVCIAATPTGVVSTSNSGIPTKANN